MSLMYECASIFKYAEFNKLALCRLMSKLREEQSCFCDTSQISASDSFNWTILISFIDEMKWVLRFSQNDDEIKFNETNLILLTSEVATLKYIKINSTISVVSVPSQRALPPRVTLPNHPTPLQRRQIPVCTPLVTRSSELTSVKLGSREDQRCSPPRSKPRPGPKPSEYRGD